MNLKFIVFCDFSSSSETLRKHPPVPILSRECTEDYTIPELNVVIPKGTLMLLPTLGFHNDEKYYPEPEKFDPDRFLPENLKGKRFVDRPYAPFGYGPRLCLGMRLGKLQVKVGIATVLRKYHFDVHESIKERVELSPRQVLMIPKNGIPLFVKRRV